MTPPVTTSRAALTPMTKYISPSFSIMGKKKGAMPLSPNNSAPAREVASSSSSSPISSLAVRTSSRSTIATAKISPSLYAETRKGRGLPGRDSIAAASLPGLIWAKKLASSEVSENSSTPCLKRRCSRNSPILSYTLTPFGRTALCRTRRRTWAAGST